MTALKDYKIDGEYICITKKELERLAECYYKIGLKYRQYPLKESYYLGSKNTIDDMLDLFEQED